MKFKALRKDITREMRKSLGRFLSIFSIVAIGVAFFAGVKASVPVMKNSADHYFDEYNFMDFKVMSTIGMTKEDASAIRKIDGVEGVYPSYSIDTLNTVDNKQKVIKVMSYPMKDTKDNPDYINQMRIINGRLPEKENECVIEHDSIKGASSKVGDHITLTSGSDDELKDTLKNTTYTIVGEVTTPYYLSYEKGSSAIGSGTIDNYIIIPDSNFKMDYYTEIYVTVKNAKKYNSYDDAYFDVIKKVETKLTSLGEERADLRFEKIKKDALKKVEDGRKEYEANKKKFDEEIKKAKQQLSDAHDQALVGQATLNANQLTSQQMLVSKKQELEQSEAQMNSLVAQYDAAKAKLNEEKTKVDTQIADLNKQIETQKGKVDEIDQQIKDVEEQLKQPDLTDLEKQLLEEKKKALEASKTYMVPSLELLQKQMETLQSNLETGMNQLAVLDEQISNAKNQIELGKQQLAEAETSAQKQFEEAQKQIDDGNTQVIKGTLELEEKEKDGAAKLAEAKEKLDKSEEEIKAMKTPQWYVLDRNSHYSYRDYGSAADRMGGIAKVFPLFFFVVAALVCLTTMTRMVDEQRQEIGTLKALGYSKTAIAMKYIMYAGVASIFGGIFGSIIGMVVFPTVIYNAWNIMYTLPEVQLQFQFGLAFTAIGIVSLITVAAAISAVYKELMDVPSQLMRPKAPKNGKKILLERVPFIWKRFNFIHKVTARNIFRYKKRFLMTVIGISGCSALLVAGFGIQDSIGEIVVLQYEELNKYDVSMTFSTDATASQRDKALDELKANKDISDAMGVAIYHGFYADEGEDKGVDIYVPADVNEYQKFTVLRTRKGHDPLDLESDGAIITEKLAKAKGISVGDSIPIDNGDGVKKDIKITGISENYVGHAIYMTPSYYKSVYHTTPKNTTLLGIMKTVNSDQEETLGNAFMKQAGIESVTFYSGIASSFEDTISSLSFIVVVLIISAGMLAFVVLYNLTNVNISERLREIATIKVLGFYDNEVSAYVYRENIILTLIGALVGLGLGIILHSLIMSLAELDTVMFGRNIYPISFVYSVLITMGFSIIVNLVMYRKLKKIPMVESLKSVE